jgi:short-subunit dehydrogenase
VTGASSGIGLAIARELGEWGFSVLLCAEDAGVSAAAEELSARGVDATAAQADLRDLEAVERLYVDAVSSGPLDVVVLNAGVGVGGGTFSETPLADHLDVVRLNVRSTVQLTGLVLPDMVRRDAGRIMITASVVADTAGPYQSTYNASKAFLTIFAAGVRRELSGSGVTITTLIPGPVETRFFARAGMNDTVLGRMWKESPEVVARQAVSALMRGRATVIGGRAFIGGFAVLLAVLPSKARTELQALLSRPRSRRRRPRSATNPGNIAGSVSPSSRRR